MSPLADAVYAVPTGSLFLPRRLLAHQEIPTGPHHPALPRHQERFSLMQSALHPSFHHIHRMYNSPTIQPG